MYFIIKYDMYQANKAVSMKFVIYTLTIEKAATLLSDGFMLNFDYSITSQ